MLFIICILVTKITDVLQGFGSLTILDSRSVIGDIYTQGKLKMHDSELHKKTSTNGITAGMVNPLKVVLRWNYFSVKLHSGEACSILFSVKFLRQIANPSKICLV